MSYLGTGATNFAYNYTLLSGGCYDTIAKKFVDKSYCAGDVAAVKATQPSTFDKILSGIAIVGSKPASSAPESSVPNWLLPVGVAAAGLGLVLILTKPKRSSAPSSPSAPAPTSNPARRRRRRR